MKYLFEKKELLQWITLIILTNMLSIYIFTSGLISFPNTIVLKNNSPEFLYELEKLNSLNNIINNNFIEEVDNKALGEKLIDTMFDFLGDKYSDYYPQEEYQSIEETYSASFGGIGISITQSDEGILIKQIVDESPAQKAGVQENDLLYKVNGEKITGLEIEDIVSRTRGDIGTDLEITVLRNGEEITYNLTREKIPNNTIYSENMDGIGYIYISTFGYGTASQFRNALKTLLEENISGLIIDLRYNGGGIVNSAIEIADIFLDAETVGYTIDNKGDKEYFTTTDGKEDIPFVILVNEYTASSSELLSGILQKSGRIVIGETTYGKGVIQSFTGLRDKTGYRLTFLEYYLKDDSKVNNIGITPNIIVENTEVNNEEIPIDNQLQTALEYLRNN